MISRKPSGSNKHRKDRLKPARRRKLLGTLLAALTAVLLLLALLSYADLGTASAQSPEVAAKDLIQRAWNQARGAGAYEFDANITQIRRPLASVTNVGRQTTREQLYLEGLSDVDAQQLEMTLWMQGGTVQDKSTGSQIRIEGDQAYARQGDQPWQKVNDFTGLFAPENDFMAYLVAAVNVENRGLDTRAGITFTRLTFDIDGQAYANHLRDQLQVDMQRRGELLPGMHVGVPTLYSGMTGSGELWIGEDGLPLRQILDLNFEPEGDEQISAEVTVNFKNFNPVAAPAPSNNSTAAAVLNRLSPIIPGAATPGALMAATNQLAGRGLILLVGIFLLILFFGTLVYSKRSRVVLAGLQLTLISTMVLTPLLTAVHAAEIGDRQQARAKADETSAQNNDMLDALQSMENNESTLKPGSVAEILSDTGADSDGDGYTDVQEMYLGTDAASSAREMTTSGLSALTPEAATPNVQLPADDGLDTDGDGLTDYVEALLGTLGNNADTDGDLIPDGQEVMGFTDAYGVAWVTDPFELDTNRDGIGDGKEWTFNAVNGVPADNDGDKTPDLFDDDDDGDGVPDKVDLSPNTSVLNIYDKNNPFSLVLNGLNPGKLTYVEFQLRPTNANHLQFAFDAFDWPDDDRQGNIQDSNGSKDDVRLLPMLEVTVPDASSNLLPLDVLEQYNIMVQDLPGSEQALYVPLYLASENKGSQHVAFNGKMIYNGAAHWGDAHQVRLVWIVQARNDVCHEFNDAGLCSAYQVYDKPQVIHTYDDTWKLTGLNVRENHLVDVATVYEDPAVDTNRKDDSALWKLSHGLDLSFMAGGTVTGTTGTRLWDVDEIANRFDHNTNSGANVELRWNISNTLSVSQATYAHLDEAMVTTAQTTTLSLLTTRFSPNWSASNPISPTLLFARQDQYRSFNLDQGFALGSNVVGWQNNRLSLNIPQSVIPLEIASTVSWSPYLFNEAEGEWQSYPIELYWDYLAGNMKADMLAEFSDSDLAEGAILLAQMYYVALTNGVFNVVQIGEQRLQQAFYNQDRPIGASLATTARAGTVFLVKFLIERQNIEKTLLLRFILARVRDAKQYGAANPIGSTKLFAAGIVSRIKALGTNSRIGLAAGVTFLVVAGIAVGIGFLIAEALSEGEAGPARIASAVIVGAITTYAGVVAPLFQIKALASIYMAAEYGGLTAAAAWSKAAATSESVSLGAKVAAGIGLVLAIGIGWGIFIYAVTSSSIAPGSVAFNTLLAQAIAATIIAVVQFALSLTLVGAILVAILGIIDLLLFILGVDFSINGWFTEQIGKFFYHFELTIEQDIDTGEPDLALVNPNRGMIDGAMMAASMAVTTTIAQDDPDDFWGWRVLPYLPAYYTRSNLLSSSFRYSLTTAKNPFNVGRDAMRGDWRSVTVDHEYAAWDMWRGTNRVTPTTNVALQAGINGALSLYLNNSYALPGVECWTVPQPFFWPYFVPICVDKTIDGNGSSDIGSYLVLDVLPSTLDGFVALDWGGNVPFPTQADYDNDGLTTRALNGNDPDDFDWDSDDDRLSDGYELAMRENGTLLKPGSADSDFDGLSDYDEIRFGTNPGFRDTDRDGLDDSEEVWHLDTRTGLWQGGWDFTLIYTDTNQSPSQTLTVQIFSDPLASDGDNDGLSDGVEKDLHLLDPVAYPFNPKVFNENPVGLYLAFSDDDRFVKPNQTLTISATVRNNLSTPLYAKGDLAMTLPAELGGSALSQEFNIFQAQSTSIVTDVTVLNLAGSGPISVTADYLTRLHDGDLSWSWAWLPQLTSTASPAAGNTRIYNARLATNPGPVGYDYAVAALEAPDNSSVYTNSNVRVLANGSSMARQASTTLGQAVNVGFPLPDTYHSSKVGNYEPAIACNEQGKCAEAYVAVTWKSCASVYFSTMHVYKEDDAGAVGEYGLKHNGTLFWGWKDGDGGDNLTIDKTRTVCSGDTIVAWEEDDSPNDDDKLGTLYPDMSGPHATSHRFKNGDDVEVYYTVLPNPNKYGALRLLDSNLNPDSSVPNIHYVSAASLVNPTADPAVATSGSKWLAGFETAENPSEIYLLSVNNNGSGATSTRLDTDDVTTGKNDHNLDLVWAGNQYLAVWESDYSATDHDIYMALINGSGSTTLRKPVDIAGSNERLPRVDYSPQLNQALAVYVSDNKIVGRFITGSSVGPRFNIGLPAAGETTVWEPQVAYDESNNIWLVSWSGIASGTWRIRYAALSPGSLSGNTTLLLPQQALPAMVSGYTHDLACSDPNVPLDPNYRITSNCAIVSSGSLPGSTTMKLDTILLESIPPWIGGGGALTNSAAEVLTVDADVPTSTITSLSPGETINISDTLVFGGNAGDLTSNIGLVEVSIDGGAWQTATGTVSWSYAWKVPPNDGAHTIQVKATDVVGNVETPAAAITIYLDRGGPTASINGTGGQFVPASQDGDGRWHVAFSGTASDALSPVAAVEATISPSGSGWQTATLGGGNSWALDYVLAEFDENGARVVNPTGDFSLTVRARDALGNVTDGGAYAILPFRLDTTPPVATLTNIGPSLGIISQTLTLTGVITDPGAAASGIQQLEIDFVPTGQTTAAWAPAALVSSGPGVTSTTWSYPVPAGLEGSFLINLRGTDEQGNQNSEGSWWTGWQGEIDTLAPQTQVTVTLHGNGTAATTNLEATIYDHNLSEAGLEFPCPVRRADRGYENDGFLNGLGSGQGRLTSLHLDCQIAGFAADPITLHVFDLYGHETVQTETPPGTGSVVLPSLASTVLTPAHESAITDISSPVNVEGGAYASNGLKTLTLSINGSFHYSTTWAVTPVVSDTLWQTTWTPPGEGVYELLAVVEDWAGGTQTELQPVTVIVDTTPPALTLDSVVLTQTHRLSAGRFELSGTTGDTLGLEEVTISIDSGSEMAADLAEPNWRFVWALPADPDGDSHNVVVEASDAGNTTTINTTVIVDAISPQNMTVTTGYSNGGAPIPVNPGETVRDPLASGLTTGWTAATDGSGIAGYRIGWTNSPTPTLSALTSYPDASAIHTTAVGEATVWFAHSAALDIHGNADIQSVGPVYIDAPTTPDYINPAGALGSIYRGWMESGCSLVGADYEVARYAPDGSALKAVQKFYTTWDGAYLRLAWTGADWDVDGDLFIYLDTASGGATAAYNPYGAGAAIALPDEGSGQMAADYLIYVEDGGSASLLSWDGSAWHVDQTLAAPNFLFDPNDVVETTDLTIPLSWLGSPTGLKLVAVASDEEALRLWAAMPDHNPLNSERAVNPVAVTTLDLPFALTQHYTWTNVGGSGVCPAAGQFENADLHFEWVAEPAGVAVGFLQHDLPGLTLPASALDGNLDGEPDTALPLDEDPVPVGLGQTVSYTLHYANSGAADATGVVVAVTAAGGLNNLSSSSISLGTIPAGSSGSVVLTAGIDPSLDGQSAELRLEVTDAVHAPFDWLWLQHDIDSVGPTDVEILSPVAYIGAYTSTLQGIATDVSGIPQITLRIDGAATQSCLDPTPYDGQWSCLWNAAGAADGSSFQFEAQGTDEWNNTGAFGPSVTLVVDTNAPSISLSSATLATLADGRLTADEILLSGSVTDDRAAGGAEICALAGGETEPTCVQAPVSPSGQTTAGWLAEVPIPGSADGGSFTLSFTGIDAAGNRTATPITAVVTADFSGPAIEIATTESIIAQHATVTALAGTITDGSGVASLTLQRNLPDNGDFLQNEFEVVPLGTGPNWSYQGTFDREGDYQLGLIGEDTEGNQTVLGAYAIRVVDAGVNVPPTADAGGPYEVNEGQTLALAGAVDDLNLIIGQIITPSWDLDGNGSFETMGILNPVFDATQIDGPDQRTVWLRVTDGEFTTTVSTIVAIRNLTPSSDAGGPYTLEEGAQLTVSGSGADPYPGDSVSFAWDLDGDGTFGDGFSPTALFDAAVLDGPYTGSVSLKVTDDDGDFSIATAPIIVTNVAPLLENLSSAPIPENTVATLTGGINDPAILDSFDLEIVWGDGRVTTAAIAPTTAGAAGIALVPGSAATNQILRLDTDALSEAGFQHRFENGSPDGWVSQDWSAYEGFSFWYYGTGTGTTVFVELYDNRNPGSTIDDAERWRYEFADNTTGWQQINLLFAAFEHVEDEVGAPDDGLGLTEVWGWALGSGETTGIETRYVDDFRLVVTNPAGSMLVDNFENGLPNGADGNGIAVGFSTRRDNWDGTGYYVYPAGTTSFAESHLYIDDDADDSYTAELLIRDDDEGFTTQTAAITVYNVAPAVTFSPATQDVQYSDGLTPIVITATDVISDPLALSTTWSKDGGGSNSGLFAGLSLNANGCSNNGDYTQTCSWTVTGITDVPAGSYVIKASLSDGDGGLTTVDIPVIVAAESTTLKFDGGNPVAVRVKAPESNASEPFSLVVTVEELEPDLAAYLAAAGNINLAQVSILLEPVGPGGTVPGICTPDPVNPVTGYADVLTVTCAFDDVPVNTYTAALIVDGGYYTGYSEDVIVIYDPSLGFTTGGGWFYWPGTTDKTNFGYTMKYNKPLTNIQGSLLLIRHLADGTVYRLKSNAIEGLSIGDTGFFGWASFSGKGTYLEPGWIDPLGNHTFLFYVEDHNEPGSGVDKVWVEVRDRDGSVVPVMSMTRPGSANAEAINGGNLVVPHSGGTGNQQPTAGFSYEINLLTVNFTDQSTDPGGSIVAWEWAFGDGSVSADQNPSHTYGASGAYDVLLTVTDNEGAQDTTAQQVTVSDGSVTTEMSITGLQSNRESSGSRWTAEVTIEVKDAGGNLVDGALVTGLWSSGASGSDSCVTVAGYCTVTKTNIRSNRSSVTFGVSNVTHPSLVYNALLNLVSSITVNKP